ncbi:MAG: flippase-like domain-containing protein [Lachnospiraceae bacterium]|nr:flippase-like domain-containing protein [Lachnospiraceae bacterium]
MKKARKWIINSLFMILLLVLTYYAVLKEEDPRLILSLLDWADGRYWVLGLFLVLVFIVCESHILRLLLNTVGSPPPQGHCLYYSFVGFFFSAITPSAGGGQPAQVVYMHKDGIHSAVSAPILVIVTICYKAVLLIYGVIAFVVRPEELVNARSGAQLWCMIGFVATAVVVLGFVLLIVKPRWVEKVLRGGLRFAGKFIRKEERLKRWDDKLAGLMNTYHDVTLTIQKNPRILVWTMLITFFQRSLLFFVTWLVMMSFGLDHVDPFSIITLQATVSLGTDLVPLPGGTGANEALFLLLFEGFCGELWVTPVLLATRGITYYGQLLISGLGTLYAGWRIKKHGVKKSESAAE